MELNKYTHEGPSNKSVFFQEALYNMKPPPHPCYFIKKMLLKMWLNKNSGIIYSCLCAPLFQFSVRWLSEVQFGAIYLETCASTVAFCTFEFHTCSFVFSRTCMAHSSLLIQKPVFVVYCVVFLFGWWRGLVCLVMWSGSEAPLGPHQCQSE